MCVRSLFPSGVRYLLSSLCVSLVVIEFGMALCVYVVSYVGVVFLMLRCVSLVIVSGR